MERRAVLRLLFLLLLTNLCLWAAGCGGKKDEVTISGTVTVEGEPIESGSIGFLPADGATHVAGGVIENGQYRVSVPPGNKIVQIRGLKQVGEREVHDEVSGTTYSNPIWVRATPVAYEAADSPLRADVTKNGEVFDFQLESQRE